MKRSFLIRLLFDKQPARFDSAFGIEESVERLSAIVKRWPFLPPYRKTLIGTVRVNKVSISLGKGGAWKPVFYGKFRLENGVTILDGYFAQSRDGRLFNALWFGFVLLFAYAIPIGVLTGSNSMRSPQSQIGAIFVPWLMFIFGVALVLRSKWMSRNNAEFISQRINSALQSRDTSSGEKYL